MKLSELEKAINIRFPEKWYEIYHTGAMEWLELSHGDFNKRRDDYLNNPNAFFMLGCDCEQLFFDDFAERILTRISRVNAGRLISNFCPMNTKKKFTARMSRN